MFPPQSRRQEGMSHVQEDIFALSPSGSISHCRIFMRNDRLLRIFHTYCLSIAPAACEAARERYGIDLGWLMRFGRCLRRFGVLRPSLRTIQRRLLSKGALEVRHHWKSQWSAKSRMQSTADSVLNRSWERGRNRGPKKSSGHCRVSIIHFWTLYSVNQTFSDTI